jgi:hypothetical protein
MQQNTERAFSAYDSRTAQEIDTLVDTVTSALESVDADSEVIETVKKQGDRTVEAAESEIAELREELKETKEHAGKERAELSGRIAEVEADVTDENPTPDAGEITIQQSDLTPAEQLSQADDPGEVTDSPTVERAISLFKNLPQWGSKTPKGVVLKPADNPLSLLEADRDESLAWKQYYRAAEALEQLSEGSVTFFDSDRHGKMVVLHKQSEAYSRVVEGKLTASSVRAEG